MNTSTPFNHIRRFASLALAAILLAGTLRAQVPQLINYQGRVAVGALNFDGSGAFKFALVSTNGLTTFWSNDGTSTAGSQPTAAVTLTVTKGLYSVLLGDTSLAGMTAIPNSVFANADVRLRVWFNDGANGSQLLTPDQRIAAVGYAMIAGGVNLPTTTGATTGAIAQNGGSLMHTFGTSNFFAGAGAGNFTMTGSGNTAIGFGALISNTTGVSNVAVGRQALRLNTAGGNTALGTETLYTNTSGDNNTASGYRALYFNTTGGFNTAHGSSALIANTSGSENTAMGHSAMGSNTTGTANTAIGLNALFGNTTGNANTASGYKALRVNSTGYFNTAAGTRALEANSAGFENTASGVEALQFNTTGNNNTASGRSALAANTTGHSNTASGFNALRNNTTGGNNIALGSGAGNALTTGSGNIAIGHPGIAGESNIIRIGTAQTDTFLTGIIHGNGAGLTVPAGNITGIVPVANGGTGSAAQNFVDLTSNQTGIGGTKAFNGNVGIGTANPAFKLDVFSATGTAIVGRSTVSSGVGVYGESALFNGVQGVANHAAHSAVVGVHNTGGTGVLGQSSGTGVHGNSLGNGPGVYGESAQFNGVRGLAHNAAHGGVVGVHDGGGVAVYGTGATGVQGDGTGVGVYGRSTTGSAVHAEGNATQSADKGGFVKAMAYVDPFLPAPQYVVRSFNSQPGASITVTRQGVGLYTVDFGFNVEGRFFSLTPQSTFAFPVGMITGASGSQVTLEFLQINNSNNPVDSRFHIVAY
jgi:hypothetical protein